MMAQRPVILKGFPTASDPHSEAFSSGVLALTQGTVVLRPPIRILQVIWRGLVALDDHWIGDLIGVICLFGLGYIGLVAAYILGGQ